MRNVWLVVRHEIVNVLSRRSFWVMTFLFPLLVLGLNIGSQTIAMRAVEGNRAQNAAGALVGYVDQAGLIDSLPQDAPAGTLKAFPDPGAAQAALQSGELSQYYIISPDYIETGQLTLVQRTFNPLASITDQQRFEYIVNYGLVGDEGKARLLINPTARLQTQAISPQPGIDRASPLAFWVPYAVMFLLFFSLTMGSSMMLQSVTKEKETRTAEVLLLSLRPRDLMLGKVLGLGAVALFQMLVWAGGGMALMERGQQVLNMAASLNLPLSFFAWVVLYFLLGYLMYASALAAIGVLAPTAREAAQFTFMVILPLLIPLWLSNVFIEEPNGGLAVFLSLFPLTAPLAMAARLATASVPPWQPAVGLVGLALVTYLFVWVAARFFRADTLLSTASLTWKRIGQELRASRPQQ
jgi:ABC-2 type transport system permease protein